MENDAGLEAGKDTNAGLEEYLRAKTGHVFALGASNLQDQSRQQDSAHVKGTLQI
jgi:hypothetical protein